MTMSVTRTDGSEIEYVTAAEAAALVRKALAKKFPETKFYVRSRTFAGGAAIDVYYDGAEIDPETGWSLRTTDEYGRVRTVAKEGTPPKEDVERIVNGFSGKNFDGMIDYGYSNDVYLDADGMPVGGRSAGSEMTRGVHAAYDVGGEEAVRKISTGCWTHVSDELPYDVKVKERSLEVTTKKTLVRAMAGEFVGPFAEPATGSSGTLGRYYRAAPNCGGGGIERTLDVSEPEPMTVTYRYCSSHGIEAPA